VKRIVITCRFIRRFNSRADSIDGGDERRSGGRWDMAVIEHVFERAAERSLPRVTVGVWLFCVVASALAMWGVFVVAVFGITTSSA
jgi:hypothetical protein